MVSKKELEFYKQQGERTKVKRGTFDNFPESIEDVCKTIQYLLIHPATLHFYNLKLSQKRIDDRGKKSIQESIDQIMKFQKKPLVEYKEPKNRVVNTCRQFSMFLCSILRERGIPARCRCGFATYFSGGWFEDHWICEYWNKKESRWVRVDAQIDDLQATAYRIERKEIKLLDLPSESFFSAGVLWQLYRKGLVSGELCGYSELASEHGAWYIRGNMLRDFFALNKVEYRYQEISMLMDADYKPNEKELLLLDEIAELTIRIDDKFDEFIAFHKNHKHLKPKGR